MNLSRNLVRILRGLVAASAAVGVDLGAGGLTVGDLKRLLRPMMAVLQHEQPADDDRWGWELKWDGVRAVAYVEDGTVRLMSRNDKDMAGSYPELSALARMLDRPVILDGEIVTLHEGRPDFGRLQSRMHVQRPTADLVESIPVLYYVFDVLQSGRDSLLDQPYTMRREHLDTLGLDRDPVRTPPWWQGGGDDVLTASVDQGLEGIVGKPLNSRYQPGRRGPWIKIKNVRHQEVVVAGWTTGEGRRAGTIGSLILGVYDDEGLRYIGNVGTGFTQPMLHDLAAGLQPLARASSPFDTPVPHQTARSAHWVAPELVGEVVFAEWTGDGILRHPSWRGLRPDKRPHQVHRES